MHLGTYAMNLQQKYMEFKWEEGSYKLYGSKILCQPLKELTNQELHKYSTMFHNQDDSPLWKTKIFHQQYLTLPCFEDKALQKGRQ